jgi:hypothetical protein
VAQLFSLGIIRASQSYGHKNTQQKHKMKNHIRILVAVLLATASFQSLKAIPVNLVQNGSFEQGLTGWGYTYNWGVWLGFPGAPDGRNWGEVDGTIYQTLSTAPGQQYDLRFALAGNANISALMVMNVLWGGSQVGTLSWNPAGHNINNLGWIWADFTVTATSPTTLLTFQDPYVGDGSGRVDFIDAISVTAVPECSSTLFLLMTSLVAIKAMMILTRHRKMMPNKSPEPTAVGAVSSAIAVHVASRRWLSFFR